MPPHLRPSRTGSEIITAEHHGESRTLQVSNEMHVADLIVNQTLDLSKATIVVNELEGKHTLEQVTAGSLNIT